MRRGITSCLVAVALCAACVAVLASSARALVCPCVFPPGPYKTWIMLDTNTVAAFDCLTGQIVTTIDVGGGCNSIVSKPDCSVVFVGTVGGVVLPGQPPKPPGFCDIDCATFQVIERPLPAPPIPNGMVCAGGKIFIAMANGEVAVFDCTTEQIQFVTVGGGCNSIIAKCDGTTVFVGTAGAAGVKPPGFCDIDCATLQVIERPLPVPPNPNAFFLTPDGSKLWIMLQDFSVCVFDCVNGVMLACIPIGGACNSITGKCDGSSVFLGNVGGAAGQFFFPQVGFNNAGGPDRGGPGGTEEFIIDSFFDVAYEVQIDIPGIGLGEMSEAFGTEGRGDTQVRRVDPLRDWAAPPGGQAEIPIEIVALQLQSVQPVQFNVDSFFDVFVELSQGQPGGGSLFGDPDFLTGDFPAVAVDSFFDVFFDVTLVDPQTGDQTTYRTIQPVRLELDPQGPPLTQVPFGCDWWRADPTAPPIPLDQVTPNPFMPPTILFGCDRLCFPPPPPPKLPGVCDIDCASLLIIQDCPMPAPPIPCGVVIKPGDQQIWAAMQDGTVGAWDCFWNPINVGFPIGGGCTSIVWKPDCSAVFVGTAGDGVKPPGICDIDPVTFEIFERPMPGVPLPKGIWMCEGAFPPQSCDGDVNGDGVVDVNDISHVLFRLGQLNGPCGDGDANGDGVNDVNDISYVLFRLGTCAQLGPC